MQVTLAELDSGTEFEHQGDWHKVVGIKHDLAPVLKPWADAGYELVLRAKDSMLYVLPGSTKVYVKSPEPT